MKYGWLTFDCYGTLIDWESGIAAAFEKVAWTSGHSYDRNRVLKLYQQYEAAEEFSYIKYREVLNRVARRICVEFGWRTQDYGFLTESLPRWRPFPDTNIALEKLATKYSLGILSNVDNDLLERTRQHFTVPMQFVVTAEQVGSYKPEQGHFKEARKKIGVGQWLHVAQSFYHDVAPCSRLGIDVAWINRKQEASKDPKITPLFIGRDLIALTNWLEGLE